VFARMPMGRRPGRSRSIQDRAAGAARQSSQAGLDIRVKPASTGQRRTQVLEFLWS
jgi:hypothetical protein